MDLLYKMKEKLHVAQSMFGKLKSPQIAKYWYTADNSIVHLANYGALQNNS